MQRYMIAKWSPHGWEPMAYISNDKAFKDAWDDLYNRFPRHSLRGFQRVLSEVHNFTVTLNEERNVLEEVEAWEMMPLDRQNALTVEFPIG
jgi:hypothetical protein